MTKSEEIQILRDAIAKLGKDSYCGAWLTDQLPAVESAIASNYPPEVYAFSIHEARIHAEKIIAQAKADAEKTRESACKLTKSIRSDLKRSIRAIFDHDTF